MNKKSNLARPACFAALTLLLATGTAMAAAEPSLPQGGVRWVTAGVGSGHVTPDAPSRLQLARSASDRARLQEVGLDFRDVYGVIHAETSWVPRTGMGRNGVASHGLAQFEPSTARAVGLRNPDDAVQAVDAAARLLREAAVWSAQRIARLGLSPEPRAAKLREGVSIYYNLSSHARAAWTGRDSDRLPLETLRHINNVRAGALQADRLNARLGGPDMPALASALPVRTATAVDHAAPARASAPARLTALGTIEWSGAGGEGPGAGRRSYVVMSNGAVRAQSNGAGLLAQMNDPRHIGKLPAFPAAAH